MSKKIVVFGGSGFIGTNLCKALRDKGHEVISIDKRDGNDILNWNEEMDTAVKDSEIVFNLSAIPAHRLSVEDPNSIIYNNYVVTLNIVNACAYYKKKLIYASSFSVYGKQPTPWTEDLPLESDTPYAHAKVACEDLLKMYHKLYGVDIIIARFSNVYGPHEDLHEPPQVLPIWMKCYKEDKMLKVYGENTTRDWTYVGDVVSALLLFMDLDGFDVYNVCSGREVRLVNVARLISGNIEVFSLPSYEAERWVGDNSKLRELGWKPTIEVEYYVQDMIIKEAFE